MLQNLFILQINRNTQVTPIKFAQIWLYLPFDRLLHYIYTQCVPRKLLGEFVSAVSVHKDR